MTTREKLPSQDALANSEFVSRETWNRLETSTPTWSVNGNQVDQSDFSNKTLSDALGTAHVLDSLQLFISCNHLP
jgi:hypothetical protein